MLVIQGEEGEEGVVSVGIRPFHIFFVFQSFYFLSFVFVVFHHSISMDALPCEAQAPFRPSLFFFFLSQTKGEEINKNEIRGKRMDKYW